MADDAGSTWKASGCALRRESRYPDVIALCGEVKAINTNPKTLLNPSVIFEILSDSTEDKDMGEKFNEYANLPSITDYLLVAQDTMHVRHYSRTSGADWQERIYTQAEDSIHLESLAVSLTLPDIYNEVRPEDILLMEDEDDELLEP